jgi:D-amino-acid dehydrogenase
VRVIVVGGGAIGLCAAEALSARGTDVVVLERDRCGGAASAGNAGWITPSLSIPLAAPGVVAAAARWAVQPSSPLWIRPTLEPEMLRWVGSFVASCRRPIYRRGVRALQALAGAAGPAFDRLAQRGAVFERHEDPLLYPAFGESELGHLHTVAADLRAGGGAGSLQPVSAAELRSLEPALGESLVGGMLASGEGQVRPEAFTAAVRELLAARGVTVREGAAVGELTRDGDAWLARTPTEEHRGDVVVLAGGVAVTALLRQLGVRLPVVAAKGYSRTFAGRRGEGGAPRRSLYLESPKVAISVFDGALRVSGTLELGARDLTLSARRLTAITRAARQALPGWAPPSESRDWAGARSVSPDGLPYVGAVPGAPGVHVATAHAMLGITLAPLTGELLAQQLLENRTGPELAALDPARAASPVRPVRRSTRPRSRTR